MKIICIEPEKSNYDILVMNTIWYKNIICIQWWLRSKETYLSIKDTNTAKRAFEVIESIKNTDIYWYSMNYIIKKYWIKNIDILKVDIEWSEKEVFGQNTERLEIVNMIVIETHEKMRIWSHQAVINATINYNQYMKWENIIFTKKK